MEQSCRITQAGSKVLTTHFCYQMNVLFILYCGFFQCNDFTTEANTLQVFMSSW